MTEQQPVSVPEGSAVVTAEDPRPESTTRGVPDMTMETDRATNQTAEETARPRVSTAPAAPALPADDEEETMASLLDNPANALRTLQRGEVIDGIVARIDPDEVLVDIGQKSEGVDQRPGDGRGGLQASCISAPRSWSM